MEQQARDKKFRLFWSLAASSLAPPDPIMVQLKQLQTLTDTRPMLARLTASND
jgi:hypothetical protein